MHWVAEISKAIAFPRWIGVFSTVVLVERDLSDANENASFLACFCHGFFWCKVAFGGCLLVVNLLAVSIETSERFMETPFPRVCSLDADRIRMGPFPSAVFFGRAWMLRDLLAVASFKDRVLSVAAVEGRSSFRTSFTSCLRFKMAFGGCLFVVSINMLERSIQTPFLRVCSSSSGAVVTGNVCIRIDPSVGFGFRCHGLIVCDLLAIFSAND